MRLDWLPVPLYLRRPRWTAGEAAVEAAKLLVSVAASLVVVAPLLAVFVGLPFAPAVAGGSAVVVPVVLRSQAGGNPDFDVVAYRRDRGRSGQLADAARTIGGAFPAAVVVAFAASHGGPALAGELDPVTAAAAGTAAAFVVGAVIFERRVRTFYAPGVNQWLSSPTISNRPPPVERDAGDHE